MPISSVMAEYTPRLLGKVYDSLPKGDAYGSGGETLGLLSFVRGRLARLLTHRSIVTPVSPAPWIRRHRRRAKSSEIRDRRPNPFSVLPLGRPGPSSLGLINLCSAGASQFRSWPCVEHHIKQGHPLSTEKARR